MAADWSRIRNDYVNGVGTYRELAKKYKISVTAICNNAKAGGWQAAKVEQLNTIRTRVEQKTAEIVANKEADRISRILSLSDVLLERIEEATRQLDTHLVTNKRKTREVKYNAKSKPKEETITETEEKVSVLGPVDRLGLQQVASALKNVKDTIQAVGGGREPEGNNLLDIIRGTTGEGIDTDDIPEIEQAAVVDPDMVESPDVTEP